MKDLGDETGREARNSRNRMRKIGVIGVIPLFAPVIRYAIFPAILCRFLEFQVVASRGGGVSMR